MGPVGAVGEEPRGEIDDDKRERKKLDDSIEEKRARDARDSVRDFEYNVGGDGGDGDGGEQPKRIPGGAGGRLCTSDGRPGGGGGEGL